MSEKEGKLLLAKALELGQSFTGAKSSVITSVGDNQIDVVESFGFSYQQLDLSYSMHSLLDQDSSFLFTANIKEDKRFESHPICRLPLNIQSLILVLLKPQFRRSATMVLFDLPRKEPPGSRASAHLLRIADIASFALDMMDRKEQPDFVYLD